MTRAEWLGLAVKIDYAWPATEFEDEAELVWFTAVREFDAAAVELAIERLVREHPGPWLPGLGALLRLLEEPVGAPALPTVVRACMDALRRTDAGSPEEPLDVVGELGGAFAMEFARERGVRAVAEADSSPSSWEGREWERAYRASIERTATRRRYRAAVGAIESAKRPELGAGE